MLGRAAVGAAAEAARLPPPLPTPCLAAPSPAPGLLYRFYRAKLAQLAAAQEEGEEGEGAMDEDSDGEAMLLGDADALPALEPGWGQALREVAACLRALGLEVRGLGGQHGEEHGSAGAGRAEWGTAMPAPAAPPAAATDTSLPASSSCSPARPSCDRR